MRSGNCFRKRVSENIFRTQISISCALVTGPATCSRRARCVVRGWGSVSCHVGVRRASSRNTTFGRWTCSVRVFVASQTLTMTSSTVPSVQSDTAQHDEALACFLPPAGPLRGAVFEGMDDTTLDDETWLARAVAAAAAQGLVRDPEDVSLRLGAVDLVDAAAETTDADAMSVSDDTATVTGHGQGNPSSVGKHPVTKKNHREEPVPRPVKGWTCWSGNKTLLVDNYDSYTFNLFHLICAVEGGVPPVVIRNDDYTWSDLELSFKTRHFTRVVLSPGPGNPAVDKDVGVMNDILKNATNTPILGVCLGHQALALVHGVDVVRAHVPMHGRVSVMTHDGGGGGLFNGIPERFTQTRYHSLTVCPASLKKSDRLIATAWTASTNEELTTGKYFLISQNPTLFAHTRLILFFFPKVSTAMSVLMRHPPVRMPVLVLTG